MQNTVLSTSGQPPAAMCLHAAVQSLAPVQQHQQHLHHHCTQVQANSGFLYCVQVSLRFMRILALWHAQWPDFFLQIGISLTIH